MKRLILSFFAAIISIVMIAGNVTEQEALGIAQKFMQGKSFQQKSMRRAPAIGDNQFYVFNVENKGGFVIVSADDRTVPILGYADKGTFNTQNMPANVKAWMEGYEAQIKALGDADVKTAPRRADKARVEPLLTCHWDQGSPYNLQTPMDEGYNCMTGCVATAMAQVMYYHKWPKNATKAIPAYTTYTKEISVAALPSVTFQWDKMKDEYTYDETGEAADAVAQLMRYCGQAVQMDYTNEESSAGISSSIMIDNFDYSKTAKDVYRGNYTATEWETLIYNEMSNHRPVLYSGNAGGETGHQFVIDGYDGAGLFHVNWGWGGYCDGFFELSVLNPDGRGIGGGTSSNGYTRWQWAIIGLQPKQGEEGEEAPVSPVRNWVQLDETTTYSRTSPSEDFTNVSIKYFQVQDGDEDITIDHKWVLCKNGEQIEELVVQTDLTVLANNIYYTAGEQANVSFGAGLADGIYEFKPMYRKSGTTAWEPCDFSDPLVAVINGNELKLMFSSDITDAVKINSVTFEGVNLTGRPLTAVVNLTNNGFANEQPLYLWVNDENKAAGSVFAYIDRGQTGKVEINFTAPKQAGTIPVKISTDEDGTVVVWNGNVNIAESKPQKLSVTFAIEGMKNYAIEGTTAKVTATIKNNGNNNYDDFVEFELMATHDGEGTTIEPVSVIKRLQVAQGQEIKVTDLQFTDLVEKQGYRLFAYYYTYDDEDQQSYLYWGGDINLTAGVSLDPAELTVSNIAVTNMSEGLVTGNSINTAITLKNTGSSAYDHNILLEVYKYNPDTGNRNWVKNVKQAAQIAVGETKTVNIEIPDLESGEQYCFDVYYFSENEDYYVFTSGIYTMEGTKIEPTWTVAGCYSLDGDASGDAIWTAATFGTSWDKTNVNNDMKKDGNLYRLTFTNLELPAGSFFFKVLRNHDWNESYPWSNYELPISKAGTYNVNFYFNPDTKEVSATANEVEGSGINLILQDKAVDIYNLQGSKVRSKATSTDGLPKGIYIINGKKITVK